jgi:diaminopimelate epimerase
VIPVKIAFTKMHGLGNDMIVLDSRATGFIPGEAQARFLGDRRLGIGCDQLLVLLPSKAADFRMVIINNDGSEVEMCGNGVRCLARFIKERGISDKNPLAIETLAGIIRPEIRGELVRVDMGEPVFEPARVPVLADAKVVDKKLDVDGNEFLVSAVSMGNPHCVIRVDDADAVPLDEIGPMIEHHPWFPRRTNVEFVEIQSLERIKVRVWERGAGATLACGTGACAAAVAMMDKGEAAREAVVALPGGELTIEWDRATNRVFMTGPAAFVFDGEIAL